MEVIIYDVLLLFVKHEEFLRGPKYISLFLVLDNAFVSMKFVCFLDSLLNFKVYLLSKSKQ
jgi:hypothetical protein